MGSTKTTQIDGDVSIGRNIALGGNATLQGGALIKGDVKILGWLEAHNIKLPYKGLFTTPENLNETYPHPHDGWWAIVGDTVPGPIYVAWHGKWEDTGAIGGNIQEIIALEEAKEYADEKAAETLREANRHTDEREVEIRRDYAAADEETLRDAKTYADDKDAEKLAEAKRYTDEKTADALEKAKDYAEEKADDALRAAKAYHDEKERNLRAEMTEADKTLRNDMQATDEAIRGEFAAADAEITDAFETADQKIIADYMEADNETLEEAKRYADEKDGEKLQEAKDYANDMDGNTLLEAKEYADAKVDELMESYEAADTEVLRAAQEYTDSKVTEVTRAYKEEIAAVDSDLDAEIARANGRETELGTAITAEETRATGVEGGLRTDLTAETARATARENEIDADYKAADTSTLNTAKAYADTQDTAKLAEAKKYTDTKVAGLVGSAPEALNTLEELADALGKNTNFSTDVLENIGKKADKTYVDTELAKKADTTHTHAYLPLTGGTMSNTNTVSNLNADLLDGLHESSLFRKKLIFGNADCDTMEDNSFTILNCDSNLENKITCTNRPSNASINGGYGVLTVRHGSYRNQIFFPYGSTSGLYVRSEFYSPEQSKPVWASWEKVYTDINKPTPADIGAAAASHTHDTYATKTEVNGKANDADVVKNTMKVAATKLDAGQNPTIAYDKASNTLTVGIPKGDTGATGAQGPAGVNATTTAVATQTVNGLMSAADKKNLDSVMSQIGDIAMILDNINGE